MNGGCESRADSGGCTSVEVGGPGGDGGPNGGWEYCPDVERSGAQDAGRG